MSEFKIKVSVDLETKDIQNQLKALDKDYKINASVDMTSINKQIQTLKKNFQNAFKFTSKDLGGFDKLIKTLSKLNKETISNNNNKPSKNVSNLVNEYKDLANTMTKLQKQLSKGGLGEDSIQRTQIQINKLTNEMENIWSKMSKSQQDSLKLFDFKNENKGIVDLNNNLNKIETQANKLKNKVENIDIEFLSDSSKGELEKGLNTIEEIRASAKEDIKLNIEVGEALNQLKDVNESINKLQKESNENAKEYSNLIAKQAKESEKSSGLKGFWDDYKKSIAAYSIGDVLGDFTVDSIRGAISTVMELDAAFTNLRKVSDTPIEGAYYESIKSQAIDTAKEVGMSSSDVIESIATATQMGAKNIEEAMSIAKSSMILANVGDMDAGAASDAVATMLNSYNLDALKEISIQQDGVTKTTTELTNAMDMLNHASNNYAIDSAGLSSALANSGSVLNAYGVSLGDSIGLITAANESMGDPDKVANGLKSIMINMAGLQTS